MVLLRSDGDQLTLILEMLVLHAAGLLAAAPASTRVGFRLGEPGPGELGVRDGMLVDITSRAAPRASPRFIRTTAPMPSGFPAGPTRRTRTPGCPSLFRNRQVCAAF